MKLFNSWIINHLGINPVKGGSPPKENRATNTGKFVKLEDSFLSIRWLI